MDTEKVPDSDVRYTEGGGARFGDLIALKALLAIIPARGGSKRLPRKNLRKLAGRPLIAWTIEAARKSPAVGRVVVSTDDAEIADVARREGAEVPFLRPPELSNDTATSIDVVLHALDFLRNNGSEDGASPVILLQPTSPLRSSDDIDAAAVLFRATAAQAVVSVAPLEHPVQWIRRIGPNGELRPFFDGPDAPRSQEAEQLYALNGALYIVDQGVLRRERTFAPARTQGYIMPPDRSVDVDEMWQFRLAECFLRNHNAA